MQDADVCWLEIALHLSAVASGKAPTPLLVAIVARPTRENWTAPGKWYNEITQSDIVRPMLLEPWG